MENNTQNNSAVMALTTESILAKPAKDTITLLMNLFNNGDIDGARLMVIFKKFAKFGDLLSKDKNFKEFKANLEAEILKYQEGTAKTFHVHGAKVTAASSGRWDFSKTEDPVLHKLYEIEKEVKEHIKLREEEIKTLAAIHEKQNTPQSILEKGLDSFNITFNHLPKFEWEEAVGDVNTFPPTKVGKPTLRFTV